MFKMKLTYFYIFLVILILFVIYFFMNNNKSSTNDPDSNFDGFNVYEAVDKINQLQKKIKTRNNITV